MGPLKNSGPGLLACIDRVIPAWGLMRNVSLLGTGRHRASADIGRGGEANSTSASVTVDARALPARMIRGTPAHLQESIWRLTAG